VRVEVIVVDNASTDGAADMVARDFPEATLIRNDVNRGFAAANNQAARIATGECLFFLNNDTLVPPGTLGPLADLLRSQPEVVLVGPRLVGRDGRPQTTHRRQPTLATFLHRTWVFRLTRRFRRSYHEYRRTPCDQEWPGAVEMLVGAALLIRRTSFEQLGGWDEGFTFGGEDLDFCSRARRLGLIMHEPRVSIVHVGSVSTRDNIGFASAHILAGYARFFRKMGATNRQMLAYKLAVTLDAPGRFVTKSLQALWRRLVGRRRAAARSWNDAQGALAFLRRGLGELWRA
jgi:GT2 family glycosyltransferase